MSSLARHHWRIIGQAEEIHPRPQKLPESPTLRKLSSASSGVSLKGALVQIMPLTWDSYPFCPSRTGPLAHDLTAPHRVCGDASYPRLRCLRLKKRALRETSGMLEPPGLCAPSDKDQFLQVAA